MIKKIRYFLHNVHAYAKMCYEKLLMVIRIRKSEHKEVRNSSFLTLPEGRVSCMALMAPLMAFSSFCRVPADDLLKRHQYLSAEVVFTPHYTNKKPGLVTLLIKKKLYLMFFVVKFTHECFSNSIVSHLVYFLD